MGLIRRIGALARREKISAEHDEELRYHLARLAENAEADPHAAQRRFGNPTLLKRTDA